MPPTSIVWIILFGVREREGIILRGKEWLQEDIMWRHHHSEARRGEARGSGATGLKAVTGQTLFVIKSQL